MAKYNFNKTVWINLGSPALNAAQLNRIEEAVDSITDGMNDHDESIENISTNVAGMRTDLNIALSDLQEKVDNAYVEDGVAYFCSGEDILFSLTGIGGGGGGGGGSGNSAVVTLTNTSGWVSRVFALNAPCVISFYWDSLENEMPTGAGTLKVNIGGSNVVDRSVNQGNISMDVSQYLTSGANRIKVSVTDVYGNVKSVILTANVVSLSISSTYNEATVQTGAFNFPYTVTGTGTKTVYFILDGDDEDPDTAEVTSSGRQSNQTIPAQSHGDHILEVYATTEVDGTVVESEHLRFGLICTVEGNTTPIIMTTFNATTAVQYENVSIPYYVYNPSNLFSSITITANEEVKVLTVDRTEQTFTYRAIEIGALDIEIACGNVSKEFELTVSLSDANIYAEEENLELYLTSTGRSNTELLPWLWEYEDIIATLTGFNYVSDGWLLDNDGNTALHVSGDARVTIPFKMFEEDFRTTGKTIEIEFATSDVLDYDAEIISCWSGDRGFKLTAQTATLKSEQSEISTQYKEDDHVRISFVVENRYQNRLIYIYINAIMSGVIQYPVDDDFSQVSPVNISIGSNYCATDIYNIRVYDNALSRFQILGNWIADTQDVEEMLERYERNDIFDEYDNIVIDKLPNDLPYMTLTAAELPQYKGDKKTISVAFVDEGGNFVSFEANNASANVQGTSSQYYPRKNYKISYRGGFIVNGQQVAVYALRTGAVATDAFTYKADVASSEGANNVELARLYNDACPDQTPPQEEDDSIRQTIDGFPIVMFQNDGSSTSFIGKYNFNNDKGTPEVYGFTDGDESWEIKNNTSDRVLFKSADFTGTDWLNDFEGSYPEDNADSTLLSQMCAWVVSTRNNPTKFKNELANHFSVDSCLFYYLFTELFLMVDSRAKNAFPTYWHSDELWRWRLYDADTALGINNEGALTFGYELEDIDTLTSGANVFNGQDSVFWVNLRTAYANELKTMYQNLRSTGVLSYEVVEQRFEDHQSKWSEAIFNEDSYYKYIQPLIQDGSGVYLPMAQGSKAEQRRWWLYNRFRYIDSKYNAGYALSDYITVRGYAKDNITVTPYAHIYATVKYGSYIVQTRAFRDNSYTLVCPLDEVNDTEIMIFSASQLSSIGDLSGLKVGFADFSMGTKLTSIKVGDSDISYTNGNLTELYLGNNKLLQTLDVRNCTALTQAVDISNCSNIEYIYFDNTAITGLSMPNGGIIKTLHLPSTITNLTIRNQGQIEEFVLPSYSNITTLRLENVSDEVPIENILEAIPANSRVRLIGFTIEMDTTTDVEDFCDYLDTMRGLDEEGNNTEKAQVLGTIAGLGSITGSWLASIQARYPNLTIEYEHITSDLKYYNYDGSSLLYTESIADGGNGTYAGTPTRSSTAQYSYSFAGWSRNMNDTVADPTATQNVSADRSIYAAYTPTIRTYTVRFYNGTTLLETTQAQYGSNAVYGGETPTYTGTDGTPAERPFSGWNPSNLNITGATDCYAQFADRRSDVVRYLNKSLTSYTSATASSVATYAFYNRTALTFVETSATTFETYAFSGCSALEVVDLTSTTAVALTASNLFQSCTSLKHLIIRSETMSTVGSAILTPTLIGKKEGAVYVPTNLVDTYKANSVWSKYVIYPISAYPATDFSTISDTVAQIKAAVDDDTYVSKYAIGDTKLIQIDESISDYIQVAKLDGDVDANDNTIPMTFVLKNINWTRAMNSTATTSGGYPSSEMYAWINTEIVPKLEAIFGDNLATVKKTYYDYDDTSTKTVECKAFLLSNREVFNNTTYESSGVVYNELFSDSTARTKYNNSGTATAWWLRSASSGANFRSVDGGGTSSSNSANSSYGVALGFCLKKSS